MVPSFPSSSSMCDPSLLFSFWSDSHLRWYDNAASLDELALDAS